MPKPVDRNRFATPPPLLEAPHVPPHQKKTEEIAQPSFQDRSRTPPPLDKERFKWLKNIGHFLAWPFVQLWNLITKIGNLFKGIFNAKVAPATAPLTKDEVQTKLSALHGTYNIKGSVPETIKYLGGYVSVATGDTTATDNPDETTPKPFWADIGRMPLHINDSLPCYIPPSGDHMKPEYEIKKNKAIKHAIDRFRDRLSQRNVSQEDIKALEQICHQGSLAFPQETLIKAFPVTQQITFEDDRDHPKSMKVITKPDGTLAVKMEITFTPKFHQNDEYEEMKKLRFVGIINDIHNTDPNVVDTTWTIEILD